jgi:hypothetical protein
MVDVYNPLDKLNLGRSVAEALLDSPVRPLAETADIVGAGVYAIYYTGDFGPYAPIVAMNVDDRFSQPIYVGKAIPKGGRKGGLGADAATGRSMRDRLSQHAATVQEAQNLNVAHFFYRCLVVDDIWIPLGENMMIETYKPIWNMVIDGFGNKTPGRGRSGQQRSPWDVIHPGRAFVDRLSLGPGIMSAEAIIGRLDEFYRGVVPAKPIGGDEEREDGDAT